jgi:hypothetical protein
MGIATALEINVRLGFRLGVQVAGPRDAVLNLRIHGGIKARENNDEEAQASSGCSPAWEIPIRQVSSNGMATRLGRHECFTKLSSKAVSIGR